MPSRPAPASRVAMLLENQPYPADVRVRSEAEALARAGWRVKVIAPRARGERRRENVRGVAVARYRLPREGGGAAAILAEYLVAALQLHVRGLLELAQGTRVLHLHNPPDTLFALAWLARLIGARVVFDHHDLAPELYAAKFGERPRAVLGALRLLERLTLRSATHVLAANESHRAIALARAGVAADSITVVRNGPPSSTIETPRADVGALTEPTLVFVGSMAVQDGVHELPDLLADLERRHGLRARLIAVGDGPGRATLKRRGRELGLGDRVRLTGRVAPEDVPALIAQADICVDPAPCNALNHCSTMVKIAEYLAAGRPVVAYRLRETERTAGDAALLADCGDREGFADHVALLARDGERRVRLAHAGALRAGELTWEHSERELIRAYARLEATG